MKLFAALLLLLAAACGGDEIYSGGALACIASTPTWPGDCINVGQVPQSYRPAIAACDHAYYACQNEACDETRRACVDEIPVHSVEQLERLAECDRERARCVEAGGGPPCLDVYLECVDI